MFRNVGDGKKNTKKYLEIKKLIGLQRFLKGLDNGEGSPKHV